jgi:hypothetical protein
LFTDPVCHGRLQAAAASWTAWLSIGTVCATGYTLQLTFVHGPYQFDDSLVIAAHTTTHYSLPVRPIGLRLLSVNSCLPVSLSSSFDVAFSLILVGDPLSIDKDNLLPHRILGIAFIVISWSGLS